MVKLPDQFAPIGYDGYYVDIFTRKLYSLKQTGALKELKHYFKSVFRHKSGYRISNQGEPRNVSDDYLDSVCQLYLEGTDLPTTYIKVFQRP